MNVLDWFFRLFRDPNADRRPRPVDPEERSPVPPWEHSPGRRLTPEEAAARRRPRPAPPWEREEDRRRRLEPGERRERTCGMWRSVTAGPHGNKTS